MQHIPARVQVLVDPADFPTITGKSVYETWLEQSGNDGGSETDFLAAMQGPSGGSRGASAFVPAGASVSSTEFTDTGLCVTITPCAPSARQIVRVGGAIGHSNAGAVTQMALFRRIGDGVFEDIKPIGASALMAVRSVSPDRMDPFAFEWVDCPESAEPVTYALYWMTHAGTARLGRRPADTLMSIPATMSVLELP
jgi:hypothetical protein